MRLLGGVLGAVLLISGCGSCRKSETRSESATTDRADATVEAPVADAAPPPAPVVVFEDRGEGGSLDLGGGYRLEVRPVGPALVVVEVKEPARPTWKKVTVERRRVGVEHSTQSDDLEWTKYRHQLTSEHSAEAGASYAYRARRDGGKWTPEVGVRLAQPGHPPPPPSKARAKASSRHAIDIEWEADVRAAVGIEVDIEAGDGWKLLTAVSPSETHFVHHFLLAKTTTRYRVATFNAHGRSAFVETASATTLEHLDPPKAPKPPPPCTTLPPPGDTSNTLADATLSSEPEVVSKSASPGGNDRYVFGHYKGCYRNMGRFGLQGDVMRTVPGYFDDGYPLLQGLTGTGMYTGRSVALYAFMGGRYEEVDAAFYCGEPYPDDVPPENPRIGFFEGDDVTRWRGPFDGCQRDEPKF